jgi:hypothetical protein
VRRADNLPGLPETLTEHLMEYVCEMPERVTSLERRRGKIVATLESGMKFIVPEGHEVVPFKGAGIDGMGLEKE